MEMSKLKKSDTWKITDVTNVLSSLKNCKSRDPHGLIKELFKPGVAGKDFQISFLTMPNTIREELFIPEFMEYANVVSIYKGRGSKMDLENDRGIFVVNLFRSILMKMVYNDKYTIVDGNMSDSNVGARKDKNI